MTDKLEYKVAKFDVKSTDDGRGEMSGCANFCGFLDDGGDIIPAGGFNSVVKQFLKGGFIAHSHEWNIKDGVVGYPIEAHEDEDGLFIRSKFHSTPDAQDIRTKVKERVEDGLDVGLSIGYRGGTPIFIYPKDYEKELPKYLKPQFLTEGLQKARRFKNVRVLPKLSELKEVSIVTTPMNILSAVDGVKSMNDKKTSIFAPLDYKWEPVEADKRVREWASQQEDQIAAYKRAFLSPDEIFNRHSLPIADVIDGELKIVEAAIQIAVDAADSDYTLRGRISAYYTKLKAEFPDVEIKCDWDAKGTDEQQKEQAKEFDETCKALGLVDAKTDSEIKAIFDEELEKVTKADPYRIWSAFCETLRKIKSIKASSNGQIDTESLLAEAIDLMVPELHSASLAELNTAAPDINGPSFYGQSKPAEAKSDDEPASDTNSDQGSVTEMDDWKKARFKTEQLKTAALRQRAGLNSGLSSGA